MSDLTKWVDPVQLSPVSPQYDEGFHDGCSESKRLNCESAQSELAALREDLAKANKDRGTLLKLHVHLRARRSYWIAEETKARRELTAAEQRNAELTEVLELLRICASLGADLKRTIDAALKPTESGASGSTCNQIREESGLPLNNPCIACNNGACIDR